MSRWFTEAELPQSEPGVRVCLDVTGIVVDQRTRWGHLQVLDTRFLGRILVLDDIVQVAERDEFIYHEMMVTLPGLVHGAVKDVLIIGGGDGGALRQALRLPGLVRGTQVEIDDQVTSVCREHLPSISAGAFEDPRTRLIHQDAYLHVRSSRETYDLIVLDLTDPVPEGPAERLFSQDFLELVARRLRPGGIVMAQVGSVLLQPAEVRTQLARMSAVLEHVQLHTAVVPSYQLTTFGFVMASPAPLPQLDRASFEQRAGALTGCSRHLTHDTYLASTALPPYLREQLAPHDPHQRSAQPEGKG